MEPSPLPTPDGPGLSRRAIPLATFLSRLIGLCVLPLVILAVALTVHHAEKTVLLAAILIVTFVSVLCGRLAGRRLSRSVAALANMESPPIRRSSILEIEGVRHRLEKSMAERQAAEHIRRESEEKYRILAENASDVIWILNVETGRFRYVSPSVERLLGYSAEEILARDFLEGMQRHSMAYLQRILPGRNEKFHQGIVEFYTDEIEQFHRNGTTIQTEVTTRYIRNPSTGQMEIIGVSRDITERKKTEELLRHQEMMLLEAAQIAHIGGWEFDPVTLEGTWTEETARIYGVCPEETPTAQMGLGFFRGDSRNRINAAVREAITHGTPYDLELELIPRQGPPKWVRAICHPIVQDGKVVRVRGSIQDITERKHAEETLRASLEEKVALLREVHHRVKNNLQIVASLLTLQANRSANPAVVAVLQDTRHRVKSMALLHEALYQSESVAHIPFAAYLKDLCDHLLISFGVIGHRVKLAYQVADIRLPLEQAVPCGLIVSELVSNALKHGFPDERAGTVTVGLVQAGDSLGNWKMPISHISLNYPAS